MLIAVDEQMQAAPASLVSPKGTLHKGVAYTAGSPAEVRAAEAARPALSKEVEYGSRQPGR